MSKLKLIVAIACLSLLFVESASAQPGWRNRRRYYYAPPVYVAPQPVYVAPRPVYVAPPPYYGPPAYTYGVVGPRGRFGAGYGGPGFGLYIGR